VHTKNKIVDKVHKKKNAFFFFYEKIHESTSTAPSHYQLGSSLTISPSHHSDPSQCSGILSNIIGVISVSSRTLPVSYRPPSSPYSPSCSFSSSSSFSSTWWSTAASTCTRLAAFPSCNFRKCWACFSETTF
jgi:hypothetical protein